MNAKWLFCPKQKDLGITRLAVYKIMFDLGRDAKDDPFKILKQELVAGSLVNEHNSFIQLAQLKEWLKANTVLEQSEINRIIKEVFPSLSFT